MRNYFTAICLFSLFFGFAHLQVPLDVFGDVLPETISASDSAGKASDAAGKGSDAAGEASDSTGKGSDAAGEATDSTGKGSDSAGKGSDATGKASDSSGKASDPAGKGSDSSGKASDPAGKGSDAAGKGSDAAGKGSDAAGEASDSTGEASDSSGKASDAAGEASDAAGEASDAAGKASDATGEGELSQEEKDRRQIEEIDDESYALYQRLVDTIEQVEENYVRPISRKELIEAAIAGVVAKLDPYSNYIPEESVGEFRTDLENRFGGLGINVSLINKKLTLVTPLANSPAYQAGLKPNDIILEIDGKSTKDQPLEKSIELMRGNVGSKIVLTISRKGMEAPFDVSLERDIIHKETVCGCSRKADDSWNYWIDAQKKIAYVRITMFSPNTGAELKTAMKSLSDANLQGLILDLRFNPGGVLGVAIETCDLFVDQGVIVSTRGRNISEKSWSAQAPGTLSGFPMVVLINKYSASAAEIVSACLQDHNRAVVMGERSWGKGSVQNVIEMNGSALKLTTSGYYRPSGNNIHRMENMSESDIWGVIPNKGFDIKLTSVQYEQILWHQRTLDILNNPAAALPPKSAFRTDLTNEETKSDQASSSSEEKTEKTERPNKVTGINKINKTGRAGKVANPAPAGSAQAIKNERETPFIDNQMKKAIEYLTEKKK